MDAAALEVLAGTQSGLGVSKIHQLSRRGSRQGIANALDRLVKHGLVKAEPTNFGFMYRLNRDHILASAVFEATSARQELFELLAAECAKLEPKPLATVVFGSLARGDSTVHSDIDLLFVLDELPEDLDPWVSQLDDLALKVESWTGNPLQTLTHDLDHLDRLTASDEPIVRSWREDGMTIFGSDIDTLLDRAATRSVIR